MAGGGDRECKIGRRGGRAGRHSTTRRTLVPTPPYPLELTRRGTNRGDGLHNLYKRDVTLLGLAETVPLCLCFVVNACDKDIWPIRFIRLNVGLDLILDEQDYGRLDAIFWFPILRGGRVRH